ncbi:phosphotransferase family protein [Nocardioides pocheonensis]|uniref:Phosphotransferase family protein n=1 Tax=Nocardioides pocheonensis TaxID=661485 RepID=A0A3N0GYY3_9ACTN|nr:phosphotransferase family protein [Nocardioides pocheonensis]RNM17426.1 phosphotransferase family protein [Nocardioides pocheonensis]
MSPDLLESHLAARVALVLRRERPGLEVGRLARLPGGHSGLTYRLETGEGPLVVKSVPSGQKAIGRHDMLRQARMIAALAPTGMPVPAVVATDDAEPAWFAMELVAGESLEPVLDDPEVPPALAASRMLRAAEILPALHDVPLDKVPVDAAPLSPLDELGRWARTMAAVPPDLVPDAERLHARLLASVPAAVAPTLVHGDYRLGNLLCHGAEPAALIDWEIWSVGDPRVELGWFLVFADGSNFPGVGREVPGLPSADELVSAYAADGRAVDELAWFEALGRYKMAAIMGHNLRRHLEGRHHDPDQERLPDTIRRLIETGLSIAP